MPTRRQLTGLTLGTAAALAVATPATALTLATPAAVPSRATPTPSARPSSSGSPSPTPQPEPWALTARRTKLTLPDLPSLGLPYLCLLDLFDEAGRKVGTATGGSMVVGVSLKGPVVLASVVLQLADGELHYQRIINRFGAFPRTAVGAILGGTGAYRGARGEVDISWPDGEQVDLVVRPAH